MAEKTQNSPLPNVSTPETKTRFGGVARTPERSRESSERQPSLGQATRERVQKFLTENAAAKIRVAADIAAVMAMFVATYELNKFGGDSGNMFIEFDTVMQNIDGETIMKFIWPLFWGPIADGVTMVLAMASESIKENNQFSQETLDHFTKNWMFTNEERQVLDAKSERKDVRFNEYAYHWVKKVGLRVILLQWGSVMGLSTVANVGGMLQEFLKTSPAEAIQRARETVLTTLTTPTAEAVTATATATATAPATAVPTEAIGPTVEILNTIPDVSPQAAENIVEAVRSGINKDSGMFVRNMLFNAVKTAFVPVTVTAAVGGGVAYLASKQEKISNWAKAKSDQMVNEVKATAKKWFEPAQVAIVTTFGGTIEISPLRTVQMTQVPFSEATLQKMNLDEVFAENNASLETFLRKRLKLSEQDKKKGIKDLFLDMLIYGMRSRPESTNPGQEFGKTLTEEEAHQVLRTMYVKDNFDRLTDYLLANEPVPKGVDYSFSTAVAEYNKMLQEYQVAKQKAEQQGKEFDSSKMKLVSRWESIRHDLTQP
jgi:hypothetical protein